MARTRARATRGGFLGSGAPDRPAGVTLNFNPGPGLSPDQSWYAGVLSCMEETLESCREVRPDFGLNVESNWDRLLTSCDAWWQWHDMLDHVPVMKYTFPEFMPNFPAVQPWDYNNVNNAIRYGYQVLVGRSATARRWPRRSSGRSRRTSPRWCAFATS